MQQFVYFNASWKRLKNIRTFQGQCHFYTLWFMSYTICIMRKLHLLPITVIFNYIHTYMKKYVQKNSFTLKALS